MTASKYVYAVGRRKTAVAQVRLFNGSGDSLINGKPVSEYIHRADLFSKVYAPIKLVGLQDKVRFEIKVEGSGESAQAQAIAHGLSRAITASNDTLKKTLKGAGFLTRDARKVERKKFGLHKARKAPTWSKR